MIMFIIGMILGIFIGIVSMSILSYSNNKDNLSNYDCAYEI